jgi:hypothetical protein
MKVIDIDSNDNFADVEVLASGTPVGNHGYYGPNTCANGYVWCETDTLDYVCVNPFHRSQVQNDNAQSPSRKQPTSNFCLQGFVWREAWPGDRVCVSAGERQHPQEEPREPWNLVANDYDSKHIACRLWVAVIP